MVSACLEIETTRDIARQILRHRSFSFQEFSQRYADPTKDLDFVLRECRLQDPKNRQNSVVVGTDTEDDLFLIAEWNRRQQEVIDLVKEHYKWATEAGIAKEQARAILPEGNTTSRMYVNGTIRSWVHFIQVRSGNGTQKENVDIALACAQAIAAIFPMASEFASN